MGNVIGNLTQGELVIVFGKLLQDVGQKMHEGAFSDEDGIAFSEIIQLGGTLASNLLAEYQDED